MSLTPHLAATDPEVAGLIAAETKRQADSLRLIASENYASAAVMEATGSVLTNKYSEGYAGKRYYQGQAHVDALEQLAIARLKSLYGAEHVNVQPYSGSPANLGVYFAFCKPGDTIMGMGLPSGGHLTHGWKVSITGKYFNAVQYGVNRRTHRIDFDEVRDLALEHRPKILFCGVTAYPRTVEFGTFREIADEAGALLIADIAHISGLVAGGVHPTPVGIADVVTSTTHKTLRGPRGGMMMCKAEHAKTIDRAIFPGLQGGPHNHTTAALAVAAKEALQPEFKAYAAQVVANAKALAEALAERGFTIITGGTDNHMVLVDMTPKELGGKPYATALEKAGIVCNYNSIPFDPRKPFDPSGIRLGTAAVTSRGLVERDMAQLASWMDEVVTHVGDDAKLGAIAQDVKALCDRNPAPGLPVGDATTAT
ncbi:MAG: serine hydroxymethyltransferase [Myxococcota bacterium]